jgi:hypothetical protein
MRRGRPADVTSQLQEIIDDYRSASARLQRLVESAPPAAWEARPAPQRWSALECLDHLNRTGEQFLPLVRQALSAAPRLEPGAQPRYRRGLMGWVLWAIMPPPVRFVRSKTTAPFEPARGLQLPALVRTFEALQREQMACVEAADGLAIDKVFITSPFNARARYTLFACLGILPRHQHRHLWQAEQAMAGRSGDGGASRQPGEEG